MKFRKGDTVLVTGGKDRGKQGKVEEVFPVGQRVLVSGLNVYKRHMKRRDEKNPGGIIERPRALPMGRVAIVCPSCRQQTRVGYMVSRNEKIRICRKCEEKL